LRLNNIIFLSLLVFLLACQPNGKNADNDGSTNQDQTTENFDNEKGNEEATAEEPRLIDIVGNDDISNSNNNNKNNEGTSRNATTASFSGNKDMQIDELEQIIAARMQEHSALLESLEKIEGSTESLNIHLEDAQNKNSQLVEKTQSVDGVLRNQINVMISRHLQDELVQIHASELKARQQLEELAARERGEESQQKKKKEYLLSHSDVHDLLNIDSIFDAHDEIMEGWSRYVMEQGFEKMEIPNLWEEDEELAMEFARFQEEHQSVLVEDEEETSTSQCASPQEAAQVIQTTISISSSLEQMESSFDHAAYGAWVVHEMTSDTFEPEEMTENGHANDWWLQYIPDDWLDAVAWFYNKYDDVVPEQILQGFASKVKALTTSTGKVNPPETVLHPMVLPGSCWPMAAGIGYITLAFPYSISISAISVDHVSPLLVSEEDLSSAPRDVQVIGYPPCQTASCRGLPFDSFKPISIMQLTYDVDNENSPSLQTFPVEFIGSDDEEDDDEDEDDPSTCKMPPNGGSSSCETTGTTPNIERDDRIAAVRFEIMSNYGNEEYSCIYRLRVHGTTSDQEDGSDEYDDGDD